MYSLEILSNWQNIQSDVEVFENLSDPDEFVFIHDFYNEDSFPSTTSVPKTSTSLKRPSYVERSRHRRSGSGFVEQSCQWIFQHASYQTWLETEQRSFLWLNGAPGSGKSIMSSVVLETLRRDAFPKTVVVGYFFDGRYKDSKDIALDVLEAILRELYQLTTSPDDLRYRTFQLFDRNLREHRRKDYFGTRISASQLRCLISRIIHEIRVEEKLILVLDGLDEIEDEYECQLVGELLALLKPHRPQHLVKTFISSRPLHRCRIMLSDELQIDIDVEEAARQAAMFYIRAKMQQVLEDRSASLLEQHGRRLKAARSFLKAKSLFETLDSSGQSLLKSDDDMAILLAQPLEITYRQQLNTIATRERPAAETILRWVIYAARPMHAYELLDALKFDMAVDVSTSRISDLCGNLVIVEDDGAVNIVHPSARDFLIQIFEAGAKNGTSSIDRSRAGHEKLAHICLRALQPSELLDSLSPRKPDWASRKVASKMGGNFSDYAQKYWRFHYKLAEGHNNWLPGYLSSRLREGFEHQFSVFWERFAHLQGDAKGPEATIRRVSHKILRSLSMRIGLRFAFVELVKLELDLGADTAVNDATLRSIAGLPSNMMPASKGESPLHMAANNESPVLIQLLLDHGADVGGKDDHGYTALHYAAAHGNSESLQLLINSRANLHKVLSISNPAHLSMKYWSYTVAPRSDQCHLCDEIHMYYIITKVPESMDDSEAYPPFQVTSSTTSNLNLSGILDQNGTDLLKVPTGHESRLDAKQILKWLPGMEMYMALRLAAKRGWNDLNQLLAAAGICDLDELIQQLNLS